jgi:DNA-binding response OmpR family regulator
VDSPLIAVINNSSEVTEVLRLALTEAGFRDVCEKVLSFKNSERDVQAFFVQHDPQALIWDISIPYEENWTFFCGVRDSGALAGRGVVLTTTNKRALDTLVGPTLAYELIGKPYDLDDVIGAIRRALTQHSSGHQ